MAINSEVDVQTFSTVVVTELDLEVKVAPTVLQGSEKAVGGGELIPTIVWY